MVTWPTCLSWRPMGLKQRHSNCCQFVRIMSQVAYPFTLFNFMDYTLFAGLDSNRSIHHHSPLISHVLNQKQLSLRSFSLLLFPVIFIQKGLFNTPIFWGLTTHPWLRVAQVPLDKRHALWWFPPVDFCTVPLHVRKDKESPQASYRIKPRILFPFKKKLLLFMFPWC